VDYIQLREKDLSTRELETLAREAVAIVREARTGKGEQRAATRLLVNSRTDVALAAGFDGVHLRGEDLDALEVRNIWAQAGGSQLAARSPVIAVSCHTLADVLRAESDGADFAVFAPVFEKRDQPGARPAGIAALREACKARIPVFALGGITVENAASCLEAGAAGVAGIRLFQENDLPVVIPRLRGLRG